MCGAWVFDETSTVVRDLVNGANATVSGTSTAMNGWGETTGGKGWQCTTLSGSSSDVVTAPSTAPFRRPVQDYTLACVFVPTVAGGSQTTNGTVFAIEYNNISTSPYVTLKINIRDAGYLSIQDDAGNTLSSQISNVIVAANTEYRLIQSRKGNSFSIYVNGVLTSTRTKSGSLTYSSSGNNLIWGCNNNAGNEKFTGYVLQTMIWDTAVPDVLCYEWMSDPWKMFKNQDSTNVFFGLSSSSSGYLPSPTYNGKRNRKEGVLY